MCFSPEADFVAAAVIAPVGVAALRAARGRSELAFAALPALFALHQLVEGFVWLGLRGDVSAGVQHAAAIAYLLYAQAVLPVLVPVAIWLLEDDPVRRRRMRPLLGLGVLVGGYLLFTIVARPVSVSAADHVVVYFTRTHLDGLVAAAYLAAACGPALLSSRRLVPLFGLISLAAVAVAAVIRYEAVTSVWCAFAALASVLVWLALRRRPRAGPGQDRSAAASAPPTVRGAAFWWRMIR